MSTKLRRFAEALPDPLMPERQVPPHVADWSRGKQG